MKIYVIPVHPVLQPRSQPFPYPSMNADYGVEQDFLIFLNKHQDLLTNNPEIAEWHYLPVFWTRWHLNHNYGQTGIKELNQLVHQAEFNDHKTFTICQYDDGPLVNLGETKIFLASRKNSHDLDIPLLRSKIFVKNNILKKKYLACFVGRLHTNPIRKKMANILSGINGVYIIDGDKGEEIFIKIISESLIALCPRGYGGNSFRFYEALQLGTVPLLISDIDTRPFKDQIKWDDISIYTSETNCLPTLINKYSEDELIIMGSKGKRVYDEMLQFQKWPFSLLKELQ